jgi:hypothetical protein
MLRNQKYAYSIRGPSQLFVCASVLRSLPPATPPASPVAPALAHTRGMLGRVFYAAAYFLLLIYTMDSQPTDKVEGVGDDIVRGGQDETPIKLKRKRIVVSAGTPTVKASSFALRGQLNHLGARLRLRPTTRTGKRGA